jgi:hypothetical protein
MSQLYEPEDVPAPKAHWSAAHCLLLSCRNFRVGCLQVPSHPRPPLKPKQKATHHKERCGMPVSALLSPSSNDTHLLLQLALCDVGSETTDIHSGARHVHHQLSSLEAEERCTKSDRASLLLLLLQLVSFWRADTLLRYVELMLHHPGAVQVVSRPAQPPQTQAVFKLVSPGLTVRPFC